MEHINSRSGRGHIKAHEIIEVLRDSDRKLRKNKKQKEGDYLVTGQTIDGKALNVCVTLSKDDEFKTELITAWVDS